MSNQIEHDPIAMFLIVRESLLVEMGIGKTCAQVGHAVSMLMLEYNRLVSRQESWTPERLLWEDWFENGIRKIVLKADDKEFEKLKEEQKGQMVLVIDSGLTKIAAGSETVLGLPPIRKSQRSKLLQRLQVL